MDQTINQERSYKYIPLGGLRIWQIRFRTQCTRFGISLQQQLRIFCLFPRLRDMGCRPRANRKEFRLLALYPYGHDDVGVRLVFRNLKNAGV